MLTSAVIVTGGDPVFPAALQEIPERAWVIAADSGLDHANSLGLRVDLLIGDLDSVSEPALRAAEQIPIQRHPADKDSTDLELALRTVATRTEIERVIVVGGHGGRIDHLLANAAIVSSADFAAVDIEWIAGPARIHVVHHHAQLHGTAGEVVSLIPIGGDAGGVSTTGLRWALAGDMLPAGSTRGVSNEFEHAVATVRVETGCLLAVQPDALVS